MECSISLVKMGNFFCFWDLFTFWGKGKASDWKCQKRGNYLKDKLLQPATQTQLKFNMKWNNQYFITKPSIYSLMEGRKVVQTYDTATFYLATKSYMNYLPIVVGFILCQD